MTALQQTLPRATGRYFRVQMRVPAEMYEQLRKLAFESRTSQSAIALDALRARLAREKKGAK
jgi:predicted transcriptional regulator